MKSTITKETYLKIYQLLDTVSPVDYDCGELCESICCTCNDENTKDKDMVIYLLQVGGVLHLIKKTSPFHDFGYS